MRGLPAAVRAKRRGDRALPNACRADARRVLGSAYRSERRRRRHGDAHTTRRCAHDEPLQTRIPSQDAEEPATLRSCLRIRARAARTGGAARTRTRRPNASSNSRSPARSTRRSCACSATADASATASTASLAWGILGAKCGRRCGSRRAILCLLA